MYICLCKAVTDHDIEASVLAGAQSLSQVQEQLEVSTGCGRCESAAQLIVDQALAKSANGQLTASGFQVAELNAAEKTAIAIHYLILFFYFAAPFWMYNSR